MGKCGKKLIYEWVHVAPDGTRTTMRDLTSAINKANTDGGEWVRHRERR